METTKRSAMSVTAAIHAWQLILGMVIGILFRDWGFLFGLAVIIAPVWVIIGIAEFVRHTKAEKRK